MVNKLTLVFLVAEIMFLGTGALLIAAAIVWLNEMSAGPTLATAARVLLLSRCPLTAAIANGALVGAAFLTALPALALPTSRTWLRVHAWLVVVCAFFTLVLGLDVWVQTLTTRANLSRTWGQQSTQVQSLLQREFSCCGYQSSTSPPFATDATCPNPIVAAARLGCIGPFSSFAEGFLNLVFTAAFGIVGLDVVVLLCAAMMIKSRGERLRYRQIDEKKGFLNG